MSDSTNVIAGVAELRARFESRHPDPDPHELGELAAQFDEARDLHNSALESLHRAAGDRALTASEQRKWDSHTRQARELDEAAAELRRQIETAKADRVAARRVRWGSVSVSGSTGRDAWDGLDSLRESPTGWVARGHSALEADRGDLSDRAKQMLAETMYDRDGAAAARFVVARSNPAYLSAFNKVLTNPERGLLALTPEESHAFNLMESTRAAMATGVGTAGYTLPLSLDSQLSALVNDGVTNPIRALATVKQAISSPHRALTSAGISATWTAEGAAWSDNSPTIGKVDVPLFKLTAYVNATFELFADAYDTLRDLVPSLIYDARATAEGAVFLTGDGTSAPKGIITAISATVGSTITATTRGSFTSASAVDTLALFNALPPRTRQSGRAAAFANQTHISTIRQQVVGTAGVPIVDMTAAVPTPLGVPLHEASAMSSATTSGTVMVVAGDLSKYMIADSIAGPTLEFVPVVMDQATGRPNGTRAWLYHQRTGADVLDVTGWRFLKA